MEWDIFLICWFMGGLVCREIVFPGLLARRSLLSPQCQVFGVSVCFSQFISYKVQLSSWQLKSLDQGHFWVTAGARKRICLLTSNQIVSLWPHASIPHVKSPLPHSSSLRWDLTISIILSQTPSFYASSTSASWMPGRRVRAILPGNHI